MSKQIKLGIKVKDIVSGLTGIVIAKITYLNGCTQYAVRPKIKKGENEIGESLYIDEEQLVVVGDGILKIKKVTNTGGQKDKIKPAYNLPGKNLIK